MLDDMGILRDAVEAYRAAATATGIAWPGQPARDTGHADRPPDMVYRLFHVDHIAEQLIWLESQGWHSQPLLPGGGGLLPWPTDPSATFEDLSFSIATPFPWRHQMPLFGFDHIVYTFVLTGDRVGEIWRSTIDPDASETVRAATSLAGLFTQWTKGIEGNVVSNRQHVSWLQVGEGFREPFDALLERVPDLDPFAFPVDLLSHEPLLRTRQRECGVDMTCIDNTENCHDELRSEIEAALASLGT